MLGSFIMGDNSCLSHCGGKIGIGCLLPPMAGGYMSITICSGDSMVASFITGDDVPPHLNHGSCEVGFRCLLQSMAG